MSCKNLFECQNLLQVLLSENTKLYSSVSTLSTDNNFRRDVLSTWKQAPLELQHAAELAYNDAVNKASIITDALQQVTNLKDILSYTINALNMSFLNISNPSNLQNINNLIDNYNTSKRMFLESFGYLLN